MHGASSPRPALETAGIRSEIMELNQTIPLILKSMKPAGIYMTTIRARAAAWATVAARGCFAAAVILIPLRFRFVLLARPALPVYGDYTDFLLYAADVAILLMLVSWLTSLALARRAITMGPRHIWIPLAGLTLAGWVSAFSSYDAPLSVYHAIRLLALFWFYVFVVNEIGSPRWILIPVGLQLATESIVALAQFVAQRSVGLQFLGEPWLDPSASGTSVVTAGGARLLRAYGLTDHPNILGGCLAFGLVLLLLACLRAAKPSGAWAAFLPAAAALLVSFSRAGWLAFGVGALFVAGAELFHRRWQSLRAGAWLGLACCLVLGAFILAYPQFFGVRVNAGNSFSGPSQERQSIGQRIILVKLDMPLLLAHPLTGVGLGASPIAMRAAYPAYTLNYEPPHWALFDAALETGLLGMLPYLALLIFPLVVFIRRKSLWSDPVATTTLALLLSVTVVGFFDYYTWLLDPGRLWQWLAWGLWGLAVERHQA